jgi:hypothetical protein
MHAHPCPLCFPTGYRENVLAVYVWDQQQPVIHLRRSLYSDWNERRCGWQDAAAWQGSVVSGESGRPVD